MLGHLICFHDVWQSLLISVLLPAAPILNKSGFTAAHTACWCYSARNSISQYIDETLLGSLRSYFWHSEIAMVTFFYNIFNNSMVDFKLMRQFEQTHTYLSNQSCFGSFYLLFLPYLFLPIYPNTFDEVTRHQPKFLSKLFHYWSYNLRVARNFSGLPPLSKENRFTPPIPPPPHPIPHIPTYGLLPLTIYVVISEIHIHLWRFSGSLWFINCAPRRIRIICLVINVWNMQMVIYHIKL